MHSPSELHASPFRCLICLDDCGNGDHASVLRCNHGVCRDCLRDMWTHNIMTDSEPFPRCPQPGCPAYASDAAVSSLVAPRTLQRMRQLRGLKPTRAADGRRMFCVAPGCHEPLPPPLPLPPPPAGEREAQGEHNAEAEDPLVSTCADCGQSACMRCGGAEHPGKSCSAPMFSLEQRLLYSEYAVGRVASCPRCGVHTEHDGGCTSVTCDYCHWKFDFRPFQTLQEAEEAVAGTPEAQVPPMRQNAAVNWNGDGSRALSLVVFYMIWGIYFSGNPLILFVDAFQRSSPWDVTQIIFLFVICCGVPIFMFGWVGVLCICGRLLLQVRDQRPNSVRTSLTLIGTGSCMLLGQRVVKPILGISTRHMKPWEWVFFMLPFALCGISLIVVSAVHLLIIASRTLMMRIRGWGEVLWDDPDVTAETQ